MQAPELVEFAGSLVAGVRRNRQELDHVLAQTADNWSLERMAATDRNVLRLGAYEILYCRHARPRGHQRGRRAGQALRQPRSRPSSSTASSTGCCVGHEKQ